MSRTLSIKGHSANLEIEVQDYENRTARDLSDANWLKCVVSLNVPPFVGKYLASFTTQDFRDLLEQLATALKDLTGTASFQNDEEELLFNVKFGSMGQVVISGTAKVSGQAETNLTFAFESDQSFLQQSLKELEAITNHFPVRF